jgi:hypothetical protein
MTDRPAESWRRFVDTLKCFGDAVSIPNPPCPEETLRAVEQRLGFSLPSPLAEILRINNGQAFDRPGIFKAVSYWNKYNRHVFLDAESIATAYETFARDELLMAEGWAGEIPFALFGNPESFKEVFSIQRSNGKVSLIWTAIYDPLMPWDWQVSKLPRGDDFSDFLAKQIGLYV